MINIRKMIRSFGFAGQGILDLVRQENNARMHLLVAVGVVAAGCWVGLSTTEWALIVMQIGLVLATEGVNTAIEKLADRVTTARDPLIRSAKDLASGAVLLVAIMAVVVGLLIFVPKFC